MGDVGDGDPDDMAAGIFGVSLGKDRVIAVAGVHRVDGDKVQIAQILALAQRGDDAAVGFGNHGVGELVRNAVLMDGNQADGAGTRRVTQPGRDAGLRQADHALAHQLALDQFAVAGTAREIARHAPFLVRSLVDRQDATAPILGFGSIGAEDSQHLQRIGPQGPDQPRFIVVILPANLGQPRQDPVARTKGRITLLRQDQDAGGSVDAVLQRLGIKIAVRVGGQHLQHGYRGQGTRFAVGPGPLLDQALLLQFA